jgi:hypothetical protein
LLIVEDIIDTGRTLETIAATVTKEAPKSVSTVALINKTNRRNTDFEATYTGFDITDEFIYGYGLDWNQQYRDLPYIAIANPKPPAHNGTTRAGRDVAALSSAEGSNWGRLPLSRWQAVSTMGVESSCLRSHLGLPAKRRALDPGPGLGERGSAAHIAVEASTAIATTGTKIAPRSHSR